MIARLLLVVALLLPGSAARAFDTAARAAILLDHRTGTVLFEKNADQPIPPASMSKLMTAWMVFERLQAGTLELGDELPVSEKAWRTGGSKMFVHVGHRVRVEDLLRGIIVQSGNDACVVVAEALAGSEEAFAAQMTRRAAELGLTRSRFANAWGDDHPEHMMSARDLALLASLLVRTFPEHLHYYSEREFTYAGIKQQNRNPLLRAGVPGVDGLKTGHTSVAGYGLVATAERDGRRLVQVVAGLETERLRRAEAERLLEHGFRDFEEYRLMAPGETVAQAGVWLGAEATVPLAPAEPVTVTLTREARKSLQVTLRYAEPAVAPITRGQPLGEVEIRAEGLAPRRLPLVAAQDVARAGMLGRLTGMVSYMVFGG
jgi:D-alanyl-D-alanine carboxypeptidase (penicillin-binding protein 5/6)